MVFEPRTSWLLQTKFYYKRIKMIKKMPSMGFEPGTFRLLQTEFYYLQKLKKNDCDGI